MPETGYPHLRLARRMSIPYEVVLLYAEARTGRRTGTPHHARAIAVINDLSHDDLVTVNTEIDRAAAEYAEITRVGLG